jgi:hypothetical protein
VLGPGAKGGRMDIVEQIEGAVTDHEADINQGIDHVET